MNLSQQRPRLIYIALSIVTIVSGLLSRSSLIALPDFISTYAGDTLWALFVYFLLCIIFSGWGTKNIAITALLIAFGVEFSQFYHAPWIDGLRQNKIGGLILGFGFRPGDLVLYAAGVSIGFVIDSFLVSRKR